MTAGRHSRQVKRRAGIQLRAQALAGGFPIASLEFGFGDDEADIFGFGNDDG
jgi:hypothetical protein